MIVQAAVTILGGFVLGYLIDAGWISVRRISCNLFRLG